jgi:hypothetical protein
MGETLDRYFFLKNGYSIWRHVVPVVLAALLLGVTSLASEDLLKKLFAVLQTPSVTWLPAIVLTFVCMLIYYLSIRAQVRQAYLWSDGDFRRTIITCVVYLGLFTGAALFVLHTSVSGSSKITFGMVWSSLLLALLSSVGVGWSLVNVAELVNSNIPDYTEVVNQLRE